MRIKELAEIQTKYRRPAASLPEQDKFKQLSVEETRRRALRLRNACDKDVMAILTPEQQRLYEKVKGGR